MTANTVFKTADLCDQFPDLVQVVDPCLLDYGGRTAFSGPIVTVEVFEDNVLVREQLEEPGEGRVLVVDGGSSLHRALLGDRLTGMAQENGWAGIVIFGCIRDAAEIAKVPIGVRALNTVPLRSHKRGNGTVNSPVHFGGVTFRPGHYLYADADGIITAPHDLLEVETEEEDGS